jgi:putative ABC transport system substrate-binding protein
MPVCSAITRRLFAGLCGAAMIAWPPAGRAQQRAMPVIGILSAGSAGPAAPFIGALRDGLGDMGYVKGRNIAIEPRWADGNYDRLPGLAAELVGHNIDVIIVPSGTPAILAAKRATATIPIVFLDGGDPVADGLVASLAQPAGNLTGVSMLLAALMPKRLDLLAELAPLARVVALLVNPSNSNAENEIRDMQQAAQEKQVRLPILKASSESEIDAAIGSLGRLHAGALVVGADPYFFNRREQIVTLVSRQAVPAIYEFREFAEVGGLMSYGPNLQAMFRQLGTVTGRVLAGAKPADLPVQQPTKFELVINMKAAKALGLTVPQTILALADDVIE